MSQDVINKINSLSAKIIQSYDAKIIKEMEQIGELDNYEIVWKQLQELAISVIVTVIKEHFPTAVTWSPKSKSTYPDLKITIDGKHYAIDIKSNEMQKNPWYDMARIDTIVETRLGPYEEEWEFVIKYDSETKRYVKSYFCLFREAVGIREECKGIKYRPYDGKVRPKSWDDFENNKVYWQNKEEFLIGIRNSQINRWKTLVQDVLIPLLDDNEKEEFKRLF